MEPANQKALLPLLRKVRERLPDKDVWCYTGYTLESDLLAPDGKARTDVTDELLSHIDVLVDGEFIEAKKNIRLRFRGSENQRLLDARGGVPRPLGRMISVRNCILKGLRGLFRKSPRNGV